MRSRFRTFRFRTFTVLFFLYRIAKILFEGHDLAAGIDETDLDLEVSKEENGPDQQVENVVGLEVGIDDTNLDLARATDLSTPKSRNFQDPISTNIGSRQVTRTNATQKEWADGRLKIAKSSSVRLSRDQDERRAVVRVRARQKVKLKNQTKRSRLQNRFQIFDNFK